MDEIIIHSEDWNEPLEQLAKLCRRLSEAGFTVKHLKCELAMRNLEFLGHNIGGVIVGLQNDNVKKIKDPEHPITKKRRKIILGIDHILLRLYS